MTADQAMAEIWGLICPDGSPDEYEITVRAVRQMVVDSAYEPTSDVMHDRIHKLFERIDKKKNNLPRGGFF